MVKLGIIPSEYATDSAFLSAVLRRDPLGERVAELIACRLLEDPLVRERLGLSPTEYQATAAYVWGRRVD